MTYPKEHFLIMQPDSVRKTLARLKTNSRRVPSERYLSWKKGELVLIKHPFWRACDNLMNDQIWDEFTRITRWKHGGREIKNHDLVLDDNGKHIMLTKRSPLYLPRWGIRVIVRLTEDVYEEPLQNITPQDCEYEGILGESHASPVNGLPYEYYTNGDGLIYGTPVSAYRALWDTLNAKRGFPWVSNPNVAVIRFEVVK